MAKGSGFYYVGNYSKISNLMGYVCHHLPIAMSNVNIWIKQCAVFYISSHV